MRNLFLLSFTLFLAMNAWGNSINKDSVIRDSAKVVKTDTIKPEKAKDSTVTSSPVEKQPSNDTAALDKIIKKDGTIILAKIINKNIYEIEYQIPGSSESKKINRENIKEIRYSNGKVESTDDSLEKRPKDWAVTASIKEWSKIRVVTNASDVSGMIDKGAIDIEFEAKKPNTDNETLERTAIVVLKKKAYALKANTILILTKDFVREYGELPSIKMTATAYGNE